MGREFVQGKERKSLKGKQGAVKKESFAEDLPEGKENGAIELESFPGRRHTNNNHMFMI